jgi:hypothetical protein
MMSYADDPFTTLQALRGQVTGQRKNASWPRCTDGAKWYLETLSCLPRIGSHDKLTDQAWAASEEPSCARQVLQEHHDEQGGWETVSAPMHSREFLFGRRVGRATDWSMGAGTGGSPGHSRRTP